MNTIFSIGKFHFDIFSIFIIKNKKINKSREIIHMNHKHGNHETKSYQELIAVLGKKKYLLKFWTAPFWSDIFLEIFFKANFDCVDRIIFQTILEFLFKNICFQHRNNNQENFETSLSLFCYDNTVKTYAEFV